MQFKQIVLVFVVALNLVPGCAGDGTVHTNAGSGDPATNAASESTEATSPTVTAASVPAIQPSDPVRGTVKETMESGGYTYVLVTSDHGEFWAAARKFAVAVGDDVELAGLQLMRNFRSQSLGRVFEDIQFVGSANVVGDGDVAKSITERSSTQDLPPGHLPLAGQEHLGPKKESKTNAPPPRPPAARRH